MDALGLPLGEGPGVLEIKCPYHKQEAPPDHPPFYYMPQVPPPLFPPPPFPFLPPRPTPTSPPRPTRPTPTAGNSEAPLRVCLPCTKLSISTRQNLSEEAVYYGGVATCRILRWGGGSKCQI